jgi:hypothetical protein
MYSEKRQYADGHVLLIATATGGIWHCIEGIVVRAVSAPGQSRAQARAQADRLAGSRPIGSWQRYGDPMPGHVVPCCEEGCTGLMACESGPGPRGASAGHDASDFLFLRCPASPDHVEVLRR